MIFSVFNKRIYLEFIRRFRENVYFFFLWSVWGSVSSFPSCWWVDVSGVIFCQNSSQLILVSFLSIGSIQGLHNIHGNFNVPNLAGTLGSRNSGLNGVPSAGVQQQNGSISSGRFASSNLPAGLSQVQSYICVGILKIMQKRPLDFGSFSKFAF